MDSIDLTHALTIISIGVGTYILYSYITFNPRSWWKKRQNKPFLQVVDETHDEQWITELIHGTVSPGWESVREEFIHNFRVRGELGAAVCVYHHGEKVVDLWGGYKHARGDIPQKWEKDTLVNIFSTTKGITSLALSLQHSRGKIDYDEKVCTYWPEFGVHQKENVTVRDLVGHATGLAGPSPPIDLDTLEYPQQTNDFLANSKMEWETPADRKGYMAILLGCYISTLIQKTTKRMRTAGEFLREEVFMPLDIQDEIYIGLPKSIPDSRLATIDAKRGIELLSEDCFPPGMMRRLILQPKSYTARAFNNPKLSNDLSMMGYNQRRVREVELPASNGHATSRSLAKIYSTVERAINTNLGTNPLGFSQDTLDELQKPATPSRLTGWYDEVLMMDVSTSLGMMKPGPIDDAPEGRFCCFGSDQKAFGTPGAGGSFAFCDPTSGIAFAYTMNRGDVCIVDDPREFSLRVKAYACADRLRRKEGEPPLPMDRLRVPHYLAGEYVKRYPFLAPLVT